MSKHNIIAGIVTVIFIAAIIALNLYSFLPNTPWYIFSAKSSLLGELDFDVDRQGIMGKNQDNSNWDDSQTRTILYISFGLVLASFVLSCIMILITLVALVKRVHKKGRKTLFVLSIFVFIINGLASLLFLRFNKAVCNDGASLLPSVLNGLINEDDSDFCTHFKGSYGGSIASFNWGPGIGWMCSVAAFAISFITIFLCSKILHTKKFGYHVIH